MAEPKLKDFDADGVECLDGLCGINGEPCVHRMNYRGCTQDYGDEIEGVKVSECRVRTIYRGSHPSTEDDEDDEGKRKPKKEVKQ